MMRNCIFFMLLVSSCKGDLKPGEYIEFIREAENGFKKEEHSKGWIYQAQYKPPAFIYLQENKNEVLNLIGLENKKTQLRNWRFFNIVVSHESKKGAPLRLVSNTMEDYNVYLGYLLSENRNNFKLSIGKDTVYPKLYLYENSYGLSPQDVFVVAFEVPVTDEKQSFSLHYEDAVLRNERVSFSFDKEKLDKEPQIKL
jgi:hypothetical protein